MASLDKFRGCHFLKFLNLGCISRQVQRLPMHLTVTRIRHTHESRHEKEWGFCNRRYTTRAYQASAVEPNRDGPAAAERSNIPPVVR